MRDFVSHWYKKFQDNRGVVIHQLEDIREKDPNLYEVLEKQSIHSLVVVPLYDNGKVIAFLVWIILQKIFPLNTRRVCYR